MLIPIDSVVVVRNGYVVLEEYPRGDSPNLLHELYSCTKSVSSALIGIAIGAGFIDSVQHRVLDFFPNRTFANLDSRKQAITLEHLLTMTSGLPWDEWTYTYGDSRNDVTRMMNSYDPVQFVLDRPMVSEPGTQWVYNSGGSHLLSAIINKTTGTDMLSFAKKRLFEPLGISNLLWSTDAFQRIPWGFMGLNLTPLDMAKLGFLYLNNGTWDGQQIIPAEWVAKSTTSLISADPAWAGPGWGYGYQWWTRPSANVYMARGYMGQNIIVAPDYDLVVVFTASITRGRDPSELFFDYILPAVGPTVPDQYSTIQEAVDHANEGDTVFVKSGIYNEHVTINKLLSLVGEGSSTTIIDGSFSGKVINILHNDVNVTGFTVQNCGNATFDAGISIENSSRCNIFRNNVSSHGFFGISLLYSTHTSVSDNNVSGAVVGFHGKGSSNNTISGNNIENNTYGLNFHASSASNVMTGNNVEDNVDMAVYIDNSNHNIVADNNMTGNGYGISVQYGSSFTTVSGNRITSNKGYGVQIVEGAIYNIVFQNEIGGNTYGMCLLRTSGNKLYHNCFVNNTNQVSSTLSYSDTWNNGCEGNYWSDYIGTDANRDGVGDVPYVIGPADADRYPLMNIYWNPCDIDHNLQVNMTDIGTSAKSFGGVPGDDLWNPHADITGPEQLVPDGKVDMRDIGLIARHFGDHYT
jgi:parallel beta-helix repeat protein